MSIFLIHQAEVLRFTVFFYKPQIELLTNVLSRETSAIAVWFNKVVSKDKRLINLILKRNSETLMNT